MVNISDSFNLVPTCVTKTTQTLHHIYVTRPDYIKEIQVPIIGLSDHYPVCLRYGKNTFKDTKCFCSK